jgi:hypothetical protein
MYSHFVLDENITELRCNFAHFYLMKWKYLFAESDGAHYLYLKNIKTQLDWAALPRQETGIAELLSAGLPRI